MQVLSCELCKIFKNPFWQNTSERLLLDFFHSRNCFLPPSELIETRFFYFWTCFITAFERDKYHELYFAKLYFGPSCSCWETDISLRHQEVSGVFWLINLLISISIWTEVFFKKAVLKHFVILTNFQAFRSTQVWILQNFELFWRTSANGCFRS